ncbi:hypothetical protein PGT21_013803 [Puccinia graminis f. sp. tritici]|uniref:Uncharacterized protein n=1 Tax=Puccinia graminis f. sp. tritici TaxID=56615 RepID=A0A5B0QI30_PUCGR|nr:hypothetical protein PGT21_013803 [Puccinia graminis f. sp. tritici]
MVDANTTRATSKKIKDSAATKNRTEDVSIAKSLIPNSGSTSMTPPSESQALSGSNPAQALSGKNPALVNNGGVPASALGGNNPTLVNNPLNPANNGARMGGQGADDDVPAGDTVYSEIVDTSESRRDRAPVAFLSPAIKPKTGTAVCQIIDEDEVDNSPAIPSLMSERQQMWSRAIAAQESGDEELADMLFKAIGRVGKGQTPTQSANKAEAPFAIPVQTASGAVFFQEKPSTPAIAQPPQEAPPNPDKFFLTEGDLVYAIGTVTNHNSVGFAPFLDENIRKLRSPLPLTIFNRKWQQRAMAHHLDRRQRSDESSGDKEKSGGYKGFAFVQEWTQTYAQWTRNHRAFCKTLHDVYKIIKFSKLLATHKNNCDDITEEFGFMVAFRYDMEVRSNTFSHRITDEDVKNAIPDISQRKESVVEQCYNVCRHFGELEWEENLYAPGLSHSNHDPLTGHIKTSKYGNAHSYLYNNMNMSPGPSFQSQNWGPASGNFYHQNNQQHNRNPHANYQNTSGGNNQGFQGSSKRPRGGYRGSNYSEGGQSKGDGNQKRSNHNK